VLGGPAATPMLTLSQGLAVQHCNAGCCAETCARGQIHCWWFWGMGQSVSEHQQTMPECIVLITRQQTMLPEFIILITRQQTMPECIALITWPQTSNAGMYCFDKLAANNAGMLCFDNLATSNVPEFIVLITGSKQCWNALF
jgi:hypothetical protein